MRRLAWALIALTRATKEYEESFAEDLFGNLELYEQAALNGDLTNAEARRARLVEDLDARWAATEGNTANDVVPGLWDERVEEGWFDGPPPVDESIWIPNRKGIEESDEVRCKLDCHAPSCTRIGMDVNNERSCKWGKWKPTVFNGASNEGGPSAPLGRTNKEPCQHSGYFPLYCSRTWAQAQSPTKEAYAAAGTSHLFAPAGLDEQDIFEGGYSGDAERCEKQCMLTVTQTPDVRPIISETPFNISNVTDASAKKHNATWVAAQEAAAEEHHRIAVEAEAKARAMVEEEKRKAKEARAKELKIEQEAKEQRRLLKEAEEAARQHEAKVLAAEAREKAEAEAARVAQAKREKERARAVAEAAAAAKVKEQAEEAASEKKKLQAQRAAEAAAKAKAAEKARLAENARKAAAEAALLQKEAERKKKREAQRLAAEKKAAAEAAEAKRLTEEAKVNATRKAEADRALAQEKVYQAEAAHAETAKRRSERAAASRTDQATRVERAEAAAIRTANQKLEALKTAGHTIKKSKAGQKCGVDDDCVSDLQCSKGDKEPYPTCKKKR